MVAGHLINGDYHAYPTAGGHRLTRMRLQFDTVLAENSVQASLALQSQFHDKSEGYDPHRPPFLAESDLPTSLSSESKIHAWIQAPDTSPSYNAARKRHQPGTGSWFLDGSEFSAWKEGPGSVLWLRGGRTYSSPAAVVLS